MCLMTTSAERTHPSAEDEVVDLCRELIRIESVNYGDGSGPGERAAAEYVASLLADVGLDPVVYESSAGRASVIARVEGEDPDAGRARRPRTPRRRAGAGAGLERRTRSAARSRTAASGAAAPST